MKDEKENKLYIRKPIKYIGLGLILLLVLISIFIISAFIGQLSQSNINQIPNNCYQEERFLEGQYIINTMYCQNCLHFETIVNNETKYLFFADEHIKSNKIQSNKSIIVNWCYVNKIKDYRVIGIRNK